MKKLVLMITALMTCMIMRAASDDNEITVSINYNADGTAVEIDVPAEISQFVNCTSGTSPHIKIVQSLSKENNPNNYVICYSLKGTTNDGSFYLEGDHKTVVELNGLTLTNPSGAAINLQNGKNNKIYVKKNTTNSLTDGKNEDTNGCIHCKGHLEFKKTGTLNIVGNSKHGIYSKEYCQIAKPTINITKAKKDGIHCKQYFWLEDAAVVNISGAGDDGIQVEYDDKDAYTGPLPNHEDVDENGEDFDENSGYFYQDAGTLTISDFAGFAIKADGKVMINGGTQNYDASKVSEDNNVPAGISDVRSDDTRMNDHTTDTVIYDVTGRQLKDIRKGQIIIIKQGNDVRKAIVQ